MLVSGSVTMSISNLPNKSAIVKAAGFKGVRLQI